MTFILAFVAITSIVVSPVILRLCVQVSADEFGLTNITVSVSADQQCTSSPVYSLDKG